MVIPRPFDFFFERSVSKFAERFELGLLFFHFSETKQWPLTADYWLTKSINFDHVTKKDFLLSSRST